MVNINMEIRKELHSHCKFKALEKGITLTEFVNIALEDYSEFGKGVKK